MFFDNYPDEFVSVKSVFVLLLVLLLVTWWIRKPRNSLPGPWRFPYVGSAQLMWPMFYKKEPEEMHLLATRLGHKYGKIYGFDIYGYEFVVINDYSIIKEASNSLTLNNKGHNNELQEKIMGSYFHSYKHNAEFRKFALKALRGFGIGKRSFEDSIVAEFKLLSEELDVFKGSPCNPRSFLVKSICSILFVIIFGEPHNERVRYMTDLNNRVVFLVGAGMWSSMLPKYYPNEASVEVIQLVQEVFGFIDKRIEEHVQDFDGENAKDFVDVYLKAIEESSKTDDPFSYLQRDNMRAAVYLLFIAGVDLPATILEWFCLYMIAYPDIQKKVQDELDSVVGRNRFPQLSDQAQLPFTRAVILETFRHVTLMPMGDFHTASEETTLRGYLIPDGATVIFNLYAVMRDPIKFPEPDRYMPERFINESGDYVGKEEVCTFGAGRRICLGEQLANKQVFVFVTHLLHRYSLVKPEDAPPITFEGIYGATFTPKPFTAKFVLRE